MIKGILFDAAGIFYRRPESTEKYVRRLVGELGLTAELSAEDRARQKDLRTQANTGLISPDKYWSELLVMFGVTDLEQNRDLVKQIDDFSDNVIPIQGSREALAALKERGFYLGIVTDTMYPIETKMRWLDQVGVSEFIDGVACSSVLGIHKPDPAIYMNALKQGRLTPAQAAFVGHDARELDGAHQAGITTVAVHQDPGAQADYTADTLLGLLDVPIFQKLHTEKMPGLNKKIDAIFLDVGNTLRIVVEDEVFAAQARRQLAALIGTAEPVESLFENLDTRWKAYRKWSFENLTEASEKELWTRFMLPDYPVEKIAPLSGKLTRLWRDKDGRRVPRPEVQATIIELSKRGYTLGIIANTITETEIPDWLEADGLAQYFKTVVLSSKVKYRKPGPEIYWEADAPGGGRSGAVGVRRRQSDSRC